MAKTMYEIRVAGVVPEQDLRDIGAVTIVTEQVNTVLYGIADEAALYGLLARLRALGIEVTEVHRVPDVPTDPEVSDDPPAPGHGDA
jgi:hypothetical protein